MSTKRVRDGARGDGDGAAREAVQKAKLLLLLLSLRGRSTSTSHTTRSYITRSCLAKLHHKQQRAARAMEKQLAVLAREVESLRTDLDCVLERRTLHDGASFVGVPRFGKAVWPNGDVYRGEWETDGDRWHMHGRGALTFADGSTYKGQLQNGVRCGDGEYESRDGERYAGRWAADRRHGAGRQVDARGTYAGCFANDLRAGRGLYSGADGDRYDGGWKEDSMDGHGIYEWSDGGSYSGTWRGDKREGIGTFKISDDRDRLEVYDGSWRDDCMHGIGRYTWGSGDEYHGSWANDRRNGKGTLSCANGDKYDGSWKDDKRHGLGTFTSRDGRTFKGRWKAGDLLNPAAAEDAASADSRSFGGKEMRQQMHTTAAEAAGVSVGERPGHRQLTSSVQ